MKKLKGWQQQQSRRTKTANITKRYYFRSISRSCHCAVTLKLRKVYLNTVTCSIPVLLKIKNRTVWYTETLLYVNIYWSNKLWKNSQVFDPPWLRVIPWLHQFQTWLRV